jgi:hypothetical protein
VGSEKNTGAYEIRASRAVNVVISEAREVRLCDGSTSCHTSIPEQTEESRAPNTLSFVLGPLSFSLICCRNTRSVINSVQVVSGVGRQILEMVSESNKKHGLCSPMIFP